MQIFYLSRDPVKAARMMCDEHMRKSIMELLQILSTVWAIHSPVVYANMVYMGLLYKPWPVISHPCVRWTMQSAENYTYVLQLAQACLDEYHAARVASGKGDRVHACDAIVQKLNEMGTPELPSGFVPMTPDFQAIPDEFKDEDGVVAYRRLYNEFKIKTMTMRWRNGRQPPAWFQHESS